MPTEPQSSDALPGTSTKAKLEAVIGTFQEFDTTMRIGTRQRREKDEHRVAELRVEMGKMEKSLGAEVKRRVEMNKSIQAWCEQQIAAVKAKFEVAIEERAVKIHERIEVISERITDLNERFEEEKIRIPADIERRGKELAAMLAAFQAEFEVEKKERLEREGRIEKLLDDQEHEARQRFEIERTAREERYIELTRIIEVNEKSRIKADGKFQNVVKEELQSLHNQIAIEAQVREREDDEIVEALNRYTGKLQASLQIINSTNT
ncbi:hypothetical protein TrVE_jg8489 [Triparma verrucosa]|uniref:SF-assemblin n=2 Tax=Triparma TaxID=722752 RepID=A0A9W7AET1_9STRA|nr:hypothetical protein TrST_g1110 [Triparma strigata]GMH93138.1 hypothetical protein TrVE_jg8489 [Triparma verrucosa]|mmetsp:Transcript_17661/g.32914  ORF Transcript_17661/g.32914 Transcript_17661/m.32914 type:complete len:264 (-) Transcript_17661:39-830(-)